MQQSGELTVSYERFVDGEARRAAFQEQRQPCIPVDLVILDRTELFLKLVADFSDDPASPIVPFVHVTSVQHFRPCSNAPLADEFRILKFKDCKRAKQR
jgi:hypothetical protein